MRTKMGEEISGADFKLATSLGESVVFKRIKAGCTKLENIIQYLSFISPAGGGRTRIWFRRGCAADDAKPLPVLGVIVPGLFVGIFPTI